MLQRWLDVFADAQFLVLAPNEVRIKDARITQYKNPTDFSTALKDAQILVIAVKPQVVKTIGETINAPQNLPIVSVAAGVGTHQLGQYFQDNVAIARAMPNLPASIGRGVSGLFGVRNDVVDKVFSALGFVQWLDDEDLMDALTALSGSGSAYIFYLTEVLEKAGTAIGLPEDIAQNLARATVQGAGALMEQQQTKHPSDLRKEVTSKGGTTAAALNVLMDGRMQGIFNDALTAARDRSKEL